MQKSEIMSLTYDLSRKMGVRLDSIFFSGRMINKWAILVCKYNRITRNIRYMKVIFSEMLLELPSDCSDFITYMAVHELAHSYVHSHSRKFWEIVGRYCPNYRELDDKVKLTPDRTQFIIQCNEGVKYVKR